MSAWRDWLFVALPFAGVLELGAHLVQTRSVVPREDWERARGYVQKAAVDDDVLVVFAPKWTDPIGRMVFGDDIATIAREARPDESRFTRALEVSIRNGHAPELAGWHEVERRFFGRVTVTTFENPSPVKVIDALLSHVDPATLTVSSGQEACPFTHGSAQSGGTGFGPAVPADRFVCPSGGFVGVSVLPDTEYHPRLVVLAPPGKGGLRLRFSAVRFGDVLRGHHGLYAESERYETGAPVTIKLSVEGRLLGSFVHRDGAGWKDFSVETPELKGRVAELVVEIATPRADHRTYGFEVTTR